MKIGHVNVGPDAPPFIVAELSGNHNQSLDRALAIVDAAADAGAHAIKLQTYTADTMTLDVSGPDFVIAEQNSLWYGQSLFALYQQAYTPWKWHPALFARAAERGLVCFSSPFDPTAVDFLESLHVPCYKIASFENGDLPLIRKVAATGKPVIISTGMADLEDLELAVRTARDAGCRDLLLLKCTSAYPAQPETANLHTIPHMREALGVPVGLSDHTMGIGVAVAAVALGAVMVEKHFTLSRADGGVDAAFSMEPHELRALVHESEMAWRALGGVSYGATSAEAGSLRFRRSLYVVRDLAAGTVITPDDVRIVRPGYGLAPKHYEAVLGRTLREAVTRGTPLSWELLA